MNEKPKFWRSVVGALMIGFAVHGLLACLQFEPFLRHGIAYKLRWVILPVDIAPLMLGIAISGNVHQPSAWGAIAIPLQWIVAGMLWHFARLLIARLRDKPDLAVPNKLS